MLTKLIRIFALVVLMGFLPFNIGLAESRFDFSELNSSVLMNSSTVNNLFSIKKGQPYDETKDTAYRTFNGGPADESPQHGYFAVPLLVIGIAGIFIFFMKND